MRLKKRSECVATCSGVPGWVHFTPHGERDNHWAYGPKGEKYKRTLPLTDGSYTVPCTDQEWEEGR